MTEATLGNPEGWTFEATEAPTVRVAIYTEKNKAPQKSIEVNR